MKAAVRYVPWIIVAVGVLYLLGAMRTAPDPEGQMNLKAFATLPVLDHGRVKPIDTYARVQLMLLSNRQEYTDEAEATGQPAVRWLLNLLAQGLANWESLVFIPDKEVREWMNLPEQRQPMYRPGTILAALAEKENEVERLRKSTEGQRTPLEEKVFQTLQSTAQAMVRLKSFRKAQKELGNPQETKVFRIENDQVRTMLGLEPREGLRYSFAELAGDPNSSDEKIRQQAVRWDQFQVRAAQAEARDEKLRDIVDVKALDLFNHLRIHDRLASALGSVLVVPPAKGDKWLTLGEALLRGEGANNPAADSWEKILHAYCQNDVKTFNKEVASYRQKVTQQMPDEAGLTGLEVWFNQFSPFYRCIGLYVLVFLLACGSWVLWPEVLRPSAFYLGITVVIVHTAALILRMYLQGRPPVTNLYSSAVFIGWGCVLLCLAIEWWYRNGIGTAVAAGLGFSTLIIAHHLGGSGDTLEMMQAVLDTNFWLATHVTTVTLGYAATFGAGFLGTAYLWRVLATTVVAFFKNKSQPDWTNPLAFVVAMIGMVGIPAVVLLVALGGMSYAFFPDQAHMLITMLGIAVFLAAAVYGGVVGMQWFTVAPQAGGPVRELPSEARWLERVTLTAGSSKTLANVVYGVVCFATMLSFIGTVLGGIWADQSWGRFWGWDPKENGAILIVIMNALILHARWGGMIKERGLVTLTIVGNMITMWSWFGTNQLGIGLHAYGFNKALVLMCSWFWFSQMGLMVVALLPLKYWRSYAQLTPVKVEKAPSTAMKSGHRSGGRGSTGIVPAN